MLSGSNYLQAQLCPDSALSGFGFVWIWLRPDLASSGLIRLHPDLSSSGLGFIQIWLCPDLASAGFGFGRIWLWQELLRPDWALAGFGFGWIQLLLHPDLSLGLFIWRLFKLVKVKKNQFLRLVGWVILICWKFQTHLLSWVQESPEDLYDKAENKRYQSKL